MGAAAIHFAVAPSHFAEYVGFGVFFVAIAWFQSAWAVVAANRDGRNLRIAGFVVNGLVIAIWIWSRTVGLPIGPEPGVPEEILASDALATAFEVLLVFWIGRSFVRVPGGDGRSHGPVVATSVLTWAVVVLLTSLALFIDAETGGK